MIICIHTLNQLKALLKYVQRSKKCIVKITDGKLNVSINKRLETDRMSIKTKEGKGFAVCSANICC